MGQVNLGEQRIVNEAWHLGATWDIAPDGERMLMIRGTPPSRPNQINVVLNWTEKLKQRVPTGR